MTGANTAKSFQPIENYGVIGNMRSIALISVAGSIDFLCYPEADSPTIFAALLDAERGGSFAISPALEDMRVKQLYLPDTNILLTRFLSESGLAELTDFMPVSSNRQYGNEIVRMMRVIKGTVRFEMRCAPRFDYARSRHKVEPGEARVVFIPDHAECANMALRATFPLRVEGADAVASFTLRAGETAMMVFGQATDNERPLDARLIEEGFDETARFWRHWIGQSTYSGRWREMVDRSALVLKLLSSIEYGSLNAAATFGLPERIGGGRNWDYRYAWLRDSAFSMYALMRLGFIDESRVYSQWIRARMRDDVEHGPLQVMYHADGGEELDEIVLESLSGYKGSRPVRIGNAAHAQLQLDIYGALMDAIYLSNKYDDGISYEGWHGVQRTLEWLTDNWRRPDEGIWEVRGGRREFLHSRLMCWVAFDRMVRLAEKRSLAGPMDRWREVRDTIYEDIFANFWSAKRKAFAQCNGSDTLDASVLLMPLMRFISPVDPRWLSTLNAIEQSLTEDALVYRYENPGSPIEGLTGTEGSFTACSFWFIECLARSHQTEKARLLFDKMLGYANHLGLYSEQLGSSGEHLGNFPQAFTHLSLISAATFLDRSLSGKRNAPWR
ncbi:MAG TPA: glycoside hydrolase family 15 protein [Gemmatimonadaceae bacterium]